MEDLSTSSILTLNVGGVRFTTTRATLTGPQAGSLAAWFDADPDLMPTLRDPSDGTYFIDRSPKHFEKILNFLRDGNVPIPSSTEERAELRIEANFFNIVGLLDALDAYEENCVHRAETTSLAIANMMYDVDEALKKADAVQLLHDQVGTTRQTDLSIRLPAMQLKVMSELLKLVHAAVRAQIP